MTKAMRELLAKKQQKVGAAQTIMNAANADGDREMTADEQIQFDAIMADVNALNGRIERQRDLDANVLSLPISADTVITGGAPMIEQDDKRGFSSYGDFCAAVMGASHNRGNLDQRLLIGAGAPSTYGGEDVGADGGFLVPPEFSRSIWTLALNEDSLVPLTDNMPITGNSMVFPSEETTPWGTDGVRAYWEGEADAATATKPKFMPNTMRLKKLMALVPVSEELLQDASGLPAYLEAKTATSIRWKTNSAIINGDGIGKPLGITKVTNALVVQAKETSQTAATVTAANVAKMFGRLHRINGNTVWMMNPDVFNQLITMTIGNSPIWTPPQSGMKDAPNGYLLGRPVMFSDHCETLGTQNDIMLLDMSGYRTLTKSGGIETATSMHLYFDAGAMAFRATYRIDGQPTIKTAITPHKGSNTRSPFVTLAVRA